MKSTRKIILSILFITIAVLTLSSCKTKNYGNFKVIQSKVIKGDYIVLPAISISDDEVVSINPDKSYHFPLIMYKAMEARLPEIADKINDFSTGITQSDADKLSELFFADYGAGLITDEKQKSAYYSIITDLTTKQEAKNAEASAFFNECYTFTNQFSNVIDTYLKVLVGINRYIGKADTYTHSHEELFTEDLIYASQIMAIWFPSLKFISSFEEKTGPYIENPWIPDWEDLIAKMKAFNDDYRKALAQIDLDDPDAIYDFMDEQDYAYYEFIDIWYDLPDFPEYNAQYEALKDEYEDIYDAAYDLYDEAYDAYWDSYWDYYWW